MTYNYRGSRFGGREGSVPDWRRAPVTASDWRDLLEDPRAAQVDNAVTWLIDKAYFETVGLAPDGDLLLRLTDKAWENDHILDADMREERQVRGDRRPFDRPRDNDRQRDNRDDRGRQRDRQRPRFNQGDGDIDQAEGRRPYNGEPRPFRSNRNGEEGVDTSRELAPLGDLPVERSPRPVPGDAPVERGPRPPINRDTPGVRLPPVQRDPQPGETPLDSAEKAPRAAEPTPRPVEIAPHPVESSTPVAPRPVDPLAPRPLSSSEIPAPIAPPVATPDVPPAGTTDTPVEATEAPRLRTSPRARVPRAAAPVEAPAGTPIDVPAVVPVSGDSPSDVTNEVAAPVKAPRASRAKPKDIVEGEEAVAPKPRTRRKVAATEETAETVPESPAVNE